jgi:hypothetical protein
MRRLLFILLLSALPAASQVYLISVSDVYADQGSGQITAYAYTEVYDFAYNPSEYIGTLYADVSGTLEPNNISMGLPRTTAAWAVHGTNSLPRSSPWERL